MRPHLIRARFALGALGLLLGPTLAGCGSDRPARPAPAGAEGAAEEPLDEGGDEGAEEEPLDEGGDDGASDFPNASEGEGEGTHEEPSNEGGDEGEGVLVVRPGRSVLRTAPGEHAEISFRLVHVPTTGAEVDVAGAAWTLSDPLPGAIDRDSGVFTAGDLGGATTVRATIENSHAEGELEVRVVLRLMVGGVDEADADAFVEDSDGDPAELLYPAPGTMLPRNIDGLKFQWRPGGVAGALHRVRLTRGYRDFEVFTRADEWTQHTGTFWERIVDEGRIGWMDVTVTPEGGEVSATHTLAFSTADIFGAIYYWSTTDAGIMRLAIGDETPDRFRVPPGAPIECVGCHAVSRDGRRIAMTHTIGIPTLGNLEILPISDPENPLVDSSQQIKSFYPTFSPDGNRIVGGSGGVLIERDAVTGAELTRAPLPDGIKAIYPDWSPLGNRLVASGTDGLFVMDFGISAADLWLWDRSGDNSEWLNPRPLVARNSPDESNFYPAWAPDGRWVAFNRGGGATGSSAVDNPLFIVRADQFGEDSGAEPIKMVNAGTTSRPPFESEAGGSWPKWSPGQGQHMWIAFSSTRPYGHTVTGGPQIWIAAVDATVAAAGLDPSSAAFWLPFQDPASGNHIPYWARYEKE